MTYNEAYYFFSPRVRLEIILTSENNKVHTILVYLYNKHVEGLHRIILNSSRGKAENETFTRMPFTVVIQKCIPTRQILSFSQNR